jgi:DNA-binding NarL/FixJ family response regulator
MDDTPESVCDVVIYCAQPVVRFGIEMLVGRAGPHIRLSAPPPGHAGLLGEVARCAENGEPVVVIVVVSDVADEAFAIIESVGARHDGTSVLVLARDADPALVQRALRSGARGFLLLDAGGAELSRAIVALTAGDAPVDPRAVRWLLEPRREDPMDLVTARQLEVLHLVAHGLTNRLVATRLGISERTVKAHLTQIFGMLGVSDRTQAVLWLREHVGTSAAQPALSVSN